MILHAEIALEPSTPKAAEKLDFIKKKALPGIAGEGFFLSEILVLRRALTSPSRLWSWRSGRPIIIIAAVAARITAVVAWIIAIIAVASVVIAAGVVIVSVTRITAVIVIIFDDRVIFALNLIRKQLRKAFADSGRFRRKLHISC